jgi:amino acid transporter
MANFVKLEYIYKRPEFLMTCIFGILFITFGNLAGNAIQFGVFMMTAINPGCPETDSCFKKAHVIGWAVSILTICALINIFTRKFAIGLNNILAILKILLIVVMAFLGIIYGSVHGDNCRQISWQNYGDSGRFGDIVLALFYAMYPYTGYEQPFYVLAEVSRPNQYFAKATTFAMLTALVLFPLVNVSYLCMTPYSGNSSLPNNMAIAFFERLTETSGTSDGSSETTGPVQGAAALLGIFIFGNLLAQTFTASRVKQEIAKEGILPWSLFFATGSDTLFARLSSCSRSRPYQPAVSDIDGHLEQTPIAATVLHWAFEVILVLVVGISLPPAQAYNFLTYLYTFTIVGVLGLLTVGGLLYLKLDSLLAGENGRNWKAKVAWKPWLDPLPAVLATAALGLLLFSAFTQPSVSQKNSLPWWVGPTVGWSIGTFGVLWWLGLQFVQWKGRWKLETRRVPYIEIDEEGNPIQKAELVEHERIPVVGDVRRRNVTADP